MGRLPLPRREPCRLNFYGRLQAPFCGRAAALAWNAFVMLALLGLAREMEGNAVLGIVVIWNSNRIEHQI